MILQRDASSQKLKQLSYRRELYESIKEKDAVKNTSKVYRQQPVTETFSLIKNIEDEQERRKNKQKEYYQQLELQRQKELEDKRRRVEEERRKEQEENMKIQREQEMLAKRYEEEKMKEQGKKLPPAKKQLEKNINPQFQAPNNIYTQKTSQNDQRLQRLTKEQQKFPSDSLDILQYNRVNAIRDSQQGYAENQPISLAYPSRIDNQEFNFPARRAISNNYYRELQLERRKFEEEANSLRELNRYLGSQRVYASNRTRSGLQNLKRLQKMLDDQAEAIKLGYFHSGQNSRAPRIQTQYARPKYSAFGQF